VNKKGRMLFSLSFSRCTFQTLLAIQVSVAIFDAPLVLAFIAMKSFRLSDTFDAFELDVEPGEVRVKAPDERLVRAASWALLSLLILGYLTEFAQEHTRIQLLKTQTPLSSSCAELVSAASFNWGYRIIYHATGLESSAQQECSEQRRIDGLLPIPNPLVVFVNLFWRSFVGESSLSVLLSRQSYLAQMTFIVAAVAALALALWTLAAKLPLWIMGCLRAADDKKKARYEGIQRELKNVKARTSW
jgi:hypothetical protein